jgi:hypothetical protein
VIRGCCLTLLALALCIPAVLWGIPVYAGVVPTWTFTSTIEDGTLTSWGDTYLHSHDLHDWSSANFDSADNTTAYWNAQNYIKTALRGGTLRVGQGFNNTASDYRVWRGVLPWDMGSLPTNITVTAASLFIMPQTVVAGDNFTVELRTTGGIHYPASPADFDAILVEAQGDDTNTAYYAAHVASTLVEDVYEEFDFGLSPNGLDLFQSRIGGLLDMALISSEDREGNDPTVGGTEQEYVDFYSGESENPPYLVIEYTVNALGDPSTLGLLDIAIFTDYQQPGDQLYLFTPIIRYNPDYVEDRLCEEYFCAKLHRSIDVEAQVKLYRWGYGFSAIYLSPAVAVDMVPSYDHNYLYLQGIDGMFIDPVEPQYVYTIQAGDWKGASGDVLDRWVMSTVRVMGIKEGKGGQAYLLDVVDSTKLNDAGEQLVLDAVPSMNAIRPNLFVSGASKPDAATHTPSPNSMVAKWGDYWGGAMDDLAGSVGLTGGWVIGVIIMALAGLVMYLIRDKTNEPTLAIIACLPVLAIGVLYGFAIVAVVLAAVVSTFLFFYTLWARST